MNRLVRLSMAVSLVSRSLLRLGLTTGHPGFAESIVRNAILSALDHSGPAKRDEQIQTLRDACQIANIDRSGLGPKQDEMRSGFSSRHPQGQLNQRGPTEGMAERVGYSPWPPPVFLAFSSK